MTDSYLGEIALFAFNNTPAGWMPCEGQQLPIRQYTALYSLLGVAYGGDAVNNFNLPDLRGRTAVNVGSMTDGNRILPQGQVLTQGSKGGAETVTLLLTQVPAHIHGFTYASSNPSASPALANAVMSVAQKTATTPPSAPAAPPIYGPPGNAMTLNPDSMSSAGGSQAHENRQPYLALQYCICTSGLYPMRN